MSDVKLKDLCFEIIQKCPNECVFCSSNANISKKCKIEFDDFKRVIDYFIENDGIEEISISGGEPFLHPDLFKMVAYCKNNGIRTVIFSSGVKKRCNPSSEEIKYLEDERDKKIALVRENNSDDERMISYINKYYDMFINPSKFSCISKEEFEFLKSIGVDKIVFDYQADDGDIDNYLMGRSEIIRECELSSLYNASVVGINIDVHFVPMKPNYKEIKDILETLELLKIPNISILKFVPQGRGMDNKDKLFLTNEELLEFDKILKDSCKNYSGTVRIGIPLNEDNTHKCNAGLEKLDIRYDGIILPCPAFKDTNICDKYGIKYYSIYDNLEDVLVLGGTRKEPLCKCIYKN